MIMICVKCILILFNIGIITFYICYLLIYSGIMKSWYVNSPKYTFPLNIINHKIMGTVLFSFQTEEIRYLFYNKSLNIEEFMLSDICTV